jgi:hypothetical protein
MDRDFIWPATITDLSTRGMGIVLGRRFEPGAGLAIELPASADRCEETLLVKVMQVNPLPGGHWMLGCGFVSELSEEMVLELVRQGKIQQAGGELERSNPAGRAGPASGRGVMDTVVANVRFCAQLGDGQALWFTAKRVYPKIPWPLATGSSLVFRTGGTVEPVSLRVVIEHCGQEDARWIVHCRYVDDEPGLPLALRSAKKIHER